MWPKQRRCAFVITEIAEFSAKEQRSLTACASSLADHAGSSLGVLRTVPTKLVVVAHTPRTQSHEAGGHFEPQAVLGFRVSSRSERSCLRKADQP